MILVHGCLQVSVMFCLNLFLAPCRARVGHLHEPCGYPGCHVDHEIILRLKVEVGVFLQLLPETILRRQCQIHSSLCLPHLVVLVSQELASVRSVWIQEGVVPETLKTVWLTSASEAKV